MWPGQLWQMSHVAWAVCICWSVCLSVCTLATRITRAKPAEPIEMLRGWLICGPNEPCILHGVKVGRIRQPPRGVIRWWCGLNFVKILWPNCLLRGLIIPVLTKTCYWWFRCPENWPEASRPLTTYLTTSRLLSMKTISQMTQWDVRCRAIDRVFHVAMLSVLLKRTTMC